MDNLAFIFSSKVGRTWVGMIGICLALTCCGGSGGGAAGATASQGAQPPASLAVAASASSSSVLTYGPAYVKTLLTAQASQGAAPYTYQWINIGNARAVLSDTTSSSPTLAATLNWGDTFSDKWQVTVTDADKHTASAVVSVSFTAPPADGMPAGATAVPVAGSIVSDTVTSTLVPGAQAYPLHIYLPPNYGSTTDTLPVIYATDGVEDQSDPTQYNGWQVPDMARIIEAKGVRAIIVGIGGYERRSTDYLMPGASSYYQFVTRELIPFVETKYRASPNGRTLSGHSYGGIFVGLALMMDRPVNRYFTNFLSLDGSYWNQPDATTNLEQSLFSASGGHLPQTTLVLSSSNGGNDVSVAALYQQLSTAGFLDWQLIRLPVYNTSHLQMFDEGFSNSIDQSAVSATLKHQVHAAAK